MDHLVEGFVKYCLNEAYPDHPIQNFYPYLLTPIILLCVFSPIKLITFQHTT